MPGYMSGTKMGRFNMTPTSYNYDTQWTNWNVTVTNCSFDDTQYNQWYRWSASNSSGTSSNFSINYVPMPSHHPLPRHRHTPQVIPSGAVVTPEDRVAAQQRLHRRRAANNRAERLLLRHLTPEQREQWRRDRKFRVVAQSGRQYEIIDRRMHNVFLLGPDGKPIEELCVYADTMGPEESIPIADGLLAQKFALEVEEEHIRERANIRQIRSREAALV